MSRIVWDKSGDRRYETGVDRGVLYLADGSGVPWNGLTSVEEDLSDVTTTAFHYDGVKYMDTRYPGDFSASLKAFTYPDEFMQFDGFAELNNGVLLAHQPVYDRFGLSYRTRIGNDLDGADYGYKIHILYNLVATPDNRSYPVISDQPTPTEFGWKISGVPEAIPGYRPTVHIVLDTTKLNRFLIADIEKILYGQDTIESNDPDLIEDDWPPTEFIDVIDGNPTDLLDGSDSNFTILDGGNATDPSDSSNILDANPIAFNIIDGNYDFDSTTFDGGTTDSSITVIDDPPVWDYLLGGTPANPGPLMVRGGTAASASTRTSLSELQPRLPPLSELVSILNNWVLIEVVDNGNGTWTATGPDEVVNFTNLTEFEISSDSAIYLDPDTYQISTTHTF